MERPPVPLCLVMSPECKRKSGTILCKTQFLYDNLLPISPDIFYRGEHMVARNSLEAAVNGCGWDTAAEAPEIFACFRHSFRIKLQSGIELYE